MRFQPLTHWQPLRLPPRQIVGLPRAELAQRIEVRFFHHQRLPVLLEEEPHLCGGGRIAVHRSIREQHTVAVPFQ